MGAKGSVEAAKINAQNWNDLEVRYFLLQFLYGQWDLKVGWLKVSLLCKQAPLD